METKPLARTIQAKWGDLSTEPVFFANMFAVTGDNEGQFHLTIGQTSPPVLVGTKEEQTQQLDHMGALPIRPLIRVAIPSAKFDELVNLLTNIRDQTLKTKQGA